MWDLADFLEKSFPFGVVVVTEQEPVTDAIAKGAMIACGSDVWPVIHSMVTDASACLSLALIVFK